MKQTRNRPIEDIRQLNLSPIPDLPGYYITPSGKVISVMELTPYEDQDGYMRVHVFKNGKHKRPGIHWLLARTYLPRSNPNQNQVRHLDGNRKHNEVLNLAWGTVQENGSDKTKHGSSKGSKNGRAKLSEPDVRAIKAWLATGRTCKCVCDELAESGIHVSVSTIEAIKNGQNWAWL